MKVGVVMPIGKQDPTGVVPGWAATRDAALVSEEAGFDSIWVYDHLLFRIGTDPTQGIDGAGRCCRRWRPSLPGSSSGPLSWRCRSATRRCWPRWRPRWRR